MNTNSHATSICKCIEIETCTHTHETRPVYKIGSSKSYESYVREQVGLVLQLSQETTNKSMHVNEQFLLSAYCYKLV